MATERLSSGLLIRFTEATEAANRAVMAGTDETATEYSREAEQATQIVQRDADALKLLLTRRGYTTESRLLDEFIDRFSRYRELDHTILGLAVENTNLKAQQLSFGAAREAADVFRRSLDAVVRLAAAKDKCDVEALVAQADAAVREIQLLQAPHIAESDEVKMSGMETQMAVEETAARRALDSLEGRVQRAADLGAATAALDRFKAVNTEIVALSRRNSNVRSLALSLGRKRTLTAACDDSLRALQEALETHDFTATR